MNHEAGVPSRMVANWEEEELVGMAVEAGHAECEAIEDFEEEDERGFEQLGLEDGLEGWQVDDHDRNFIQQDEDEEDFEQMYYNR